MIVSYLSSGRIAEITAGYNTTSSRCLSPEQVRYLTEAGVVGSKSVWSLHTGAGKNRNVKDSLVTIQLDEGRWHNDIKKATVKCKVEYGLTQSICFT